MTGLILAGQSGLTIPRCKGDERAWGASTGFETLKTNAPETADMLARTKLQSITYRNQTHFSRRGDDATRQLRTGGGAFPNGSRSDGLFPDRRVDDVQGIVDVVGRYAVVGHVAPAPRRRTTLDAALIEFARQTGPVWVIQIEED